MTRGCGPRPGRFRRWTRRTAPICARSMRPSRACAVSGHGRSHRADHRRGTRGRPSFRVRAAGDGVCRPRAVRAFQRHETGARRDHQNRECPSAARARRSGVALAAPTLRRDRAAPTPAGRAGRHRRAGLDRAAALTPSLPSTCRPRETAPTGHHGRGPRTHRLCVGRVDPVS